MENRQEKSRREVRDFNLKTGRLASGEPFDFATDFVLDQDRSLSAKVKVAANVTADLERNVASPRRAEDRRHGFRRRAIPPTACRSRCAPSRSKPISGSELYSLDGLTVKTTWKGDGLPPPACRSRSARRIATSISRRRRWSSAGSMPMRPARTSRGSLTGAEILDAPSFKGSLKLEPLSLREWLPKLGVDAPQDHRPERAQAAELRRQRATHEVLGRSRRHRHEARRHDHARHARRGRFRCEGAALRSERRPHQRRPLSAAAEREAGKPRMRKSRRRRFRWRCCAS